MVFYHLHQRVKTDRLKSCLEGKGANTIALVISLIIWLWSNLAFAAHPLITDDTGTQGRGKFQLEITGEYGHEDEDGVTEDTTETAAILSYGINDRIDMVLGFPYQNVKTEESESTTTEYGVSDISLELKWRFFEEAGLSSALKPGITLPTGDHDRGLGTGKTTYSLFFINTKRFGPWALHLNFGYIRNENKIDERKNILHASLASETELARNLKVVANIGLERNTDKSSSTHPAFALAGLIYSISENFDLDFGVKGGLNKPETDYSILVGIAILF